MSTKDVDELAKNLLVAMHSNPNVHPEDYRHNVTIALRAAQALNVILVFGPEVNWADAFPKKQEEKNVS